MITFYQFFSIALVFLNETTHRLASREHMEKTQEGTISEVTSGNFQPKLSKKENSKSTVPSTKIVPEVDIGPPKNSSRGGWKYRHLKIVPEEVRT